jgi:hypothetical protein
VEAEERERKGDRTSFVQADGGRGQGHLILKINYRQSIGCIRITPFTPFISPILLRIQKGLIHFRFAVLFSHFTTLLSFIIRLSVLSGITGLGGLDFFALEDGG